VCNLPIYILSKDFYTGPSTFLPCLPPTVYADYVIVLVNGQQDINQLVSVVNDFGIISAVKVNWEKSEALAVGKWEEKFLVG